MSKLKSKSDLIIGLSSPRIWGTLAWHDIRQRYRRSVLGPLWFTLSTSIMVCVLGTLYSKILHQEISHYLPFLAAGLVVWQFISISAMEGCNVFITYSTIIKQLDISLTVHVCRVVWRNFVILLHSLPIVILAKLFFGEWPNQEILLLPISLMLLLLNAVWPVVLLGILCARYRDVFPIVSNFLQVAFFLTPVMWTPDVLGGRSWVASYNPLYHLIEIVRAPLLGGAIQADSWFWSSGMALIGLGISQFFMARYRDRVAYWV